MKKRNLLFSFVTAIAMMMLCPQGALAVVAYTMPVSGNLIFDPDGVNISYSGVVDVDYIFQNNTCVIKFTSDSYVSSKGLELEATAIPFLTNILYTAEKQADGKYNVNFTFVNKYAETTYTVKEGTETVGTVADGATTLALTGVSEDAHNYTFTDGTNGISVTCYIGACKMPTNGTSRVTLDANESIKIYDDGGADNNYSNNCDGTIKLTAPKGYVIHVTGTCAAEDSWDYLIIDSDKKWDCGNDDGNPTDVDYTSQNNTCEIRFTSDDDYNYDGFALTATAVPYSPIATLNSAGYATYSSAKNFVVATDGVKAYTATVNATTSEITLTAVGDGEYVPAGTGVILYGDGMADTDVLFQAPSGKANSATNWLNATIAADGSLATISSYNGTWDDTKGYYSNIWVLGEGSQMLHYSGTKFIDNRAFMQYSPSTSAKAMYFVFADDGDVTTGVEEIENGELEIENSVAYNLAGQRVNNGAKGFVIKNGKKYLVK